MALSKLDYGSYKSWPDNEKSAVFKFLSAFWRKLLTEESDVIDAYFEGYFLALANIYPDFNQMLQIWLVTENQFADRRLANFVCKNHKKLLKKRLAGHEEMVHQGELFFEWLRSPVVLKKLKQALPSESYPYLDLELITVVQQFEKPI